MIFHSSSYLILTTFHVAFMLCAGFLCGKLINLVREGGLTPSLCLYFNLSTAEHSRPPFSEGKRLFFITFHNTPYLTKTPQYFPYVLTYFLQPGFLGFFEVSRFHGTALQLLRPFSPSFYSKITQHSTSLGDQ